MVRNFTRMRQVLDESSESEPSVQEENVSTRSTRSQTKNKTQPTTSKQPSKGNKQPSKGNQQPSKSNQQPSGAQRRKSNCPQPAHLMEIMKHQTTTNTLIPRLPLSRLLKEILQSYGHYRTTKMSIEAIQEAAEVYLVQLLEDSYKLTLHRKRVTLMPGDMTLILYLRGSEDPGNP